MSTCIDSRMATNNIIVARASVVQSGKKIPVLKLYIISYCSLLFSYS